MKTLTKDQAKHLLAEFFDDAGLTFRSIKVLKEVFDEAVALCNENREEAEAESKFRNNQGYLPSMCVELDARDIIADEITTHLSKDGIGCSDKVKDSLVDLLIEQNEYSPEDFYLL